MKNFLFLLLVVLSYGAHSQSVNDYRYVVIPTRFELQSQPNQYRLNTLVKKYLTESGFEAVHESLMTDDQINQRCHHLFVDVVKVKSLLTIKLKVVLRDCRNNVVFESQEGSSKEKAYEKGYPEALARAFESVKALHYSYAGAHKDTIVKPKPISAEPTVVKTVDAPATPPAAKLVSTTKTTYTVEALASGYLIIEAETSRIALKILKTSDPKVFSALRGGDNGVFLNKDGKWYFEYYRDGKLYAEAFDIDYAF